MAYSIEELTKMADAFTVFSRAAKRLPLNTMTKLKHLDEAAASSKALKQALQKAQRSSAGAWGGLLGLAVGLALSKGLFNDDSASSR